MQNIKAETLAETLNDARLLTLFYFKQLSHVDLFKRFKVEDSDVYLNSIHWIMAHLAVSENFLCLHSIGGEKLAISWARQYGMGSTGEPEGQVPDISEILELLNLVHNRALAYIRSMTDEQLNSPTINGVQFGTEDTRAALIRHAIRHESLHAGHLSWLCKCHQIKTF